MAGSMNWSRARMDMIIGQRGSESAFEPTDAAPQPPRRSPSARPRRRLRGQRARRVSARRGRAPSARWSRSGERCVAGSSGSRSASAKHWPRSSGSGCWPCQTHRPPPTRCGGRTSSRCSHTHGHSRPGRRRDRLKRRERLAKRKARARNKAARRAAAKTVGPRSRPPTPRLPLPNGLQPGARLWVTKDGAREPGLLFTAVGPQAARVAVLREGKPALRLMPSADIASREHADDTDRTLAKFLAGDPVGPLPPAQLARRRRSRRARSARRRRGRRGR